ncbi:MAG: winged helix-turn-helix transcriptional regulator [Clostridia bacterium]|nr:winged helix-turn-helix transcriptional regulator [Clostridia bacterium]MBQ8338944.1 winged helix-turn-helix transcriptional regulator [Clostridia bacterium]
MQSLNRSIGVVSRCGALWRTERLAGTGVGPHDHPYLFYICHHPGVSQDALCRALYVNKSSVTRHITHLEAEGFITRAPAEHDRRVMQVFPTEKSMAALPLLRQVAGEWNAVLTEGFSEEERALFAALLERAVQNAKNKLEEKV